MVAHCSGLTTTLVCKKVIGYLTSQASAIVKSTMLELVVLLFNEVLIYLLIHETIKHPEMQAGKCQYQCIRKVKH